MRTTVQGPAIALLFATILSSGLSSGAIAGTTIFAGTRSNIIPGAVFGGRCAPALTVSMAPGAFLAQGTSNLGAFSFSSSHCIASPPPGAYYDGELEWSLADGTLLGTYVGELFATDTPGLFTITEDILFTGGTGRYTGASGSASASGTVQFGMYEGGPASFGEATFTGTLSAPAIPEPASWAMMIAGFGLVGMKARRRRGTTAGHARSR